MTTLASNLTRIHPLILIPGIGIASYIVVGFFAGSTPSAKAPPQSVAAAAASGRSSALAGGGIPDQMPKTLFSPPAAAPVTPSAPVAVAPMNSGGGASTGSSGSGASAPTGHSHEFSNGHMPLPHASVAPHRYHDAPHPHTMPVAPPQVTQHFAAASPVYRPAPAPVPFFGGFTHGFNGGGHFNNFGGGGGHHR